MYDTNAIGELATQVNELARFCAQLIRENTELRNQVSALRRGRHWPTRGRRRPAPEPESPAEPGREPGIKRGTAGLALVGAAAGVVATVILPNREPAGRGPDRGREHARRIDGRQRARVGGRHGRPDRCHPRRCPEHHLNAALGNDFRVTLGGSRIFGNPSGSVDGQRITFTIRQGAGGAHQVAWSNRYKFGAAGAPVLTTTAGSTDVIGFVFNGSLGSWLCVGAARGF